MTARSPRNASRPDGRGDHPLGPDSLTWKYFGDLRTGMLGVWIGAIQNMYPELGAGVEDHSILLREPLQRVARSVYPIMGVVYDGERAAQTGEQIKGFHKTIRGIDADGRRYHALNPETFYWAHATFFMLIIKTAEYFCGGLTEAEKRQLFGKLVELAFVVVPDKIRLHPRALAAYRRAEGRLPEDAPLVEAPAFMAPPSDRRGMSLHYLPPRKTLLGRAGSLVHTTFSLAGLRPARGRGKAA